MDFQSRSTQPHSSSSDTQAATSSQGVPGYTDKHRSDKNTADRGDKWLRIVTAVLLFSVTVLFIAIAISLYYGGGSEAKLINTSGFQAVDVNITGSSATDQVYFGHLKVLNDKYAVIDDVYYIPSSTTGSVVLQPLVCQFDEPYNQVIVNVANISWWENLQSSSTVSTTIAQYEKANPNGPTCPSTKTSSNSVTPAK